ncbi:MAG: exosortase system-associated protein, TIGR04073 family [Methylococcales bacterium]
MFKFNRLLVSLFLTGFLITFASASPADDVTDKRSYGQKVGDKALNGFTNLTTGILEIPKSIITTTNESNIIYGAVGGLFKGMVHTAGRMGVGITDLITAPLPTKPIAHPGYIWDDFDTETTYGDTFRLDRTQKIKAPVAELPPPRPVVPMMVPAAPVQDRSELYNANTNKKLDRLFKKEMMK